MFCQSVAYSAYYHRDQLERVAAELLKAETLDASAFKRLLGTPEHDDADRPGHPVEFAPPV